MNSPGGGAWIVPPTTLPTIPSAARRGELEAVVHGLLDGLAEPGVWKYLGVPDDVDREALLSVALEAAWEAAETWKPDRATLRTYFTHLLRMRLVELVRFNCGPARRFGAGSAAEPEDEPPADASHGPVETAELRDLVAVWLSRLPFKCRAAAETLAGGGTKRMAAAAAGVSVDTITFWIKTRFAPALSRLLEGCDPCPNRSPRRSNEPSPNTPPSSSSTRRRRPKPSITQKSSGFSKPG